MLDLVVAVEAAEGGELAVAAGAVHARAARRVLRQGAVGLQQPANINEPHQITKVYRSSNSQPQ